ncbi:spermidine/putrescine transport system ATP-binding protein [Nocardioides sp. J9]|uniref:ABC transporter ATP-binding protein n=1 Tax=Nocardioides sp. J9 TaxID=935844 RepID=UPI0011A325CC|nr:ABC transporter ATP-binding protein [Nocardioides sp. J9]TWG91511.1 spermidine/putrescine transport system ATP-binding protein [Nocardioides sp. J9]
MSLAADRTDTTARPAEGPRDLRLAALTKEFATFTAVRSLDLTVPAGTFFALLGPSGCGKTTTLRMVAGLETPTSGTIHLGDRDITWEKSYRRPVNTVFQNYALFPHLDIHENVAFGLRRRGVKDVDQQVQEMLELVELESQARKKPPQMSGGQQQRVALARALINRPEVLLLDEPLGALDLKLRRSMQIEIKRIQEEVGLTFVHVTHDQEEAMTMADTIAVMNGGVIEQMGSPTELYENPQTTFVANFLGQSNLIAGTVASAEGDVVRVDMHGTQVSIPVDRAHTRTGAGWVGIRPEKVLVAPAGEPIDAPGNHMTGGVVTDVSFVGVSTQYLVRMPWGQELMAFEQNTGRRKILRHGAEVDVSWRPEFAFLLPADQDVRAGAFEED